MEGFENYAHRITSVLSYRHDGLGARLMCMGNGIRLATAFGCGFGFVWTMDPGVANISAPSQLFDVRAMARQGIRFTTFAKEFAQSADPRLMFADGYLKTINMAAVPPGSTLFITCPHVLRMDGEGHTSAREGLRNAMKMIVPAPRIAKRIAAFVPQHDLASAIGVHVRRGDILNPGYPRRDKRVIELDQYFAMLDVNRTMDEDIFLCTEDASVIEAFEVRYPKRVIRFPTRSWDRSDKEGVEDALIEIIALSRTSFVIAGPSSFNRTATGLGFIPLLTLGNAAGGDPRNFLNAAQELIKFRMLDRAAMNLAACHSAPESEQLTAVRRLLDAALTASKGPEPSELPV